jgi:hypothetical protein
VTRLLVLLAIPLAMLSLSQAWRQRSSRSAESVTPSSEATAPPSCPSHHSKQRLMVLLATFLLRRLM